MGRDRTRRAVRRVVALLLVLAAWLAVAGVGGPLVGRLSEVQRNDNASFLPELAESTQVLELAARFSDAQTLPYLVVVQREGGLTEADAAAVRSFVDAVPDLRVDVGTAGPSPRVGEFLAGEPTALVQSQDGEALLAPVSLDADAAAENLADGESVVFGVAVALRNAADDLRGDGLDVYVAGPGGVLADFVTAFAGIDGRLLQVTLSVVFVILLLVYRSPVLPFAALLTALVALAAAGGVIYRLADAGVIQLNGQSQGILFILVVGAATDYALLLVSRYREELHDHASKYVAMRRAWRAAVEPITASAATVALGLLCLLLADLGSTRGLGPVGAIGVVAAMVAVLTFLPVLLLWPVLVLGLLAAGAGAAVGAAVAGTPGALGGAMLVLVLLVGLALLRRRALERGDEAGPSPWYARAPSGRWLFWPRVPRPDHLHTAEVVGGRSLWGRLASTVGRHPRRVWVVTLAGLLALAAFVPSFQAEGTSQTEVFRTPVESVTGQRVLADHFPAGSGSPAVVVAPQDLAARVLDVVRATDGVGSAAPVPASPTDPAVPRVVDGLVEIDAVLTPAADSPEAEDVVQTLRQRLDQISPDVLVGGSSAVNLDVREASRHDMRVIIPAVLVVILVVLTVLLRSLVAPLLLVAANVVSFAATIGTSALVFNHLLDLPGADPAIPLYGFVFLVALGIDYSIFLMTRVREESLRRGTRPGVLVGLAVTGGVITSAGVVLAATFSALVTLPLLFLLQIAFIVAFGVLLDTLVVRSLLVPAVSYDIGRWVWWPSRLFRVPSGRLAR